MKHLVNNEQCIHLSAPATAPFPWQTQRTRVFASGREAMIALLKALDFPPKTSVLLPAFVPEGIIAPFLRSDFTVIFYSLNRHLSPSWEQLEQLLAIHSPKVAVMIHYFGIAQPIQQFCQLCHRHGVLVVEDLAHVLQSTSSSLGTTGDFVLYSLPKMLGVPDGAPLVIRTPNLNPEQLVFIPDNRHTLYVTKQLAHLVAATFTRRVAGPKTVRLLRRLIPWRIQKFTDAYDTLMEYFEHPNPMSKISHYLLGKTDWQAIIRHHCQLAQRYQEKLDPEMYERFPGSAGVQHAMVGFPVLVSHRDSLVEYLNDHNIRGVYFEHRWDFFREQERHLHNQAIETMHHNFLFPMAYGISLDEVDYVIDIANRWNNAEPVPAP